MVPPDVPYSGVFQGQCGHRSCVTTHSSSVLVPWYRLQIRFRIRIRFLDPQYLRFEFDSLSRTTWLFVSFSFRIENRNEFTPLPFFLLPQSSERLPIPGLAQSGWLGAKKKMAR